MLPILNDREHSSIYEYHPALTGTARCPQSRVQVIRGIEGCHRLTLAASRLQKAGVIRSRRGPVRILHRRQLEKRACESYGVIRELSLVD